MEDRLRADQARWRERLLRGEIVLHVAPSEVRFQPTPGMLFHHHPEIFLQLGGRTEFTFPQRRLTLKTGEICVVPSGVPHGEIARDGAAPFRTLVIIYPRATLGCIYARAGEKRIPVIAEVRTFQPIDLEPVDGLVRHCQFFAERAGQMPAARHILGALLGITAQALDHPLPRPAHEGWSALVLRGHDLVEQRFTSPHCNVARLAEELGCTPNYLSAKFHRETGETLTHFLSQRRLEHARHLLRTTSLNVKAVAQASGYEHPSYFIARFKQACGRTPRDWALASVVSVPSGPAPAAGRRTKCVRRTSRPQ